MVASRVYENRRAGIHKKGGGFESYFYFGQIISYRLDFLEKVIKTLSAVRDGKGMKQHFSIRVSDKAVVLIFGNINFYS